MLYGEQHEKVRGEALDFLLRLHEDAPDLFCVNFLVMTWGEMTRDYVGKKIEGVRRLGQLGHAGGKQADLYRAAMTTVDNSGSPMWKYPATFDMEGKGGYWHRAVPPRMGKEVGKTGYKNALSKILSGWGSGGDAEKPNVEGKGDGEKRSEYLCRVSRQQRLEVENAKWEFKAGEGNMYGGVAPRKSYPAGRRLPPSERSQAMSHTPITKGENPSVGISARMHDAIVGPRVPLCIHLSYPQDCIGQWDVK